MSLEDEELDIIHTLVPDEVYQQILKDVARSGGHLHSDATEKEMEKFQDELTQLICWVLHRHPRLKLVLQVFLFFFKLKNVQKSKF